MDFFCLPILCGCSTKISGEGNDARVCPRCHNLAVQPAKKREWFELFCIPIIPYSSDHVWICSICNWQVTRNGNFEPMRPQQYQPQPQGYMQPGYGPPQGYEQQQHMQAHPQQGYQQPGYQQHSGPKV
ncbi:hypothetical protein P389DRAFT_171447 [Cystobasidium minutum MCA 4210]|uniref:uncharacterized protein n=1 Tax=Cystobasidium minutum MCA 4210 TaxID=1397322 RepID=UPI0034CFD5C5|eukprot:jgi/Rhomi1/171447/fgenesh1_kg.4_\